MRWSGSRTKPGRMKAEKLGGNLEGKMVNFYGVPERPTRFEGKTAHDLIRAMDALQKMTEEIGLSEEETEAVKIAIRCVRKVSEQLKI